jgi:hypothetical protein
MYVLSLNVLQDSRFARIYDFKAITFCLLVDFWNILPPNNLPNFSASH